MQTAIPESLAGDRFIGRTAELAALESLYSSSTALPSAVPPRLLTLTGVGGSGKTRLAEQLTERVRSEFTDGSVWLELAPLSDPSLLALAVLDALDLEVQPELAPEATLVAELASRQLLLILDNCEHLLEACAALAQLLLSRCPELSIMATSREPLGIRGETIYQVQPLSLPADTGDEQILASDAVRLFDLRAREVLPDFTLSASNTPAVVQVCSRLDGLPLAIELAAVRVRLMTVSEIAARLDDTFRLLTRNSTRVAPRHQTLRAAMDWSYDLLSQSESALLRRVSVFAGGFTLGAVEQVCGDAENESPSAGGIIPSSAVLDLLSNLANKSLIVIGEQNEDLPTRYGMLETVRQYAQEKLSLAGEFQTLLTRHLVWSVAFAEQAAPELLGAGQAHWMGQLDAENPNLRSALRFAAEKDATELGLRLANALFRYWDRRGNFSEAIGWYNKLLAGDLAAVPGVVHAQALFCLAAFHYRLSDLDRAFAIGESSLALARQLDDHAAMATTLNLLGVLASEISDFDRSIAFHEQALALRRELDDPWNIAASLHNLGYAADQQGRTRTSLEYYAQSLALKRQLGDPTAIALTLNNMGVLALGLGDYVRGEQILSESLELNRTLGDKQGVVLNLTNLGAAAFYLGDYKNARLLLDECIRLATELGNKGDLGAPLVTLGELDLADGHITRARTHFENALALFRAAGDQVAIALALHNLALADLASGELISSAELQTASLELYQKVEHYPGMATAFEGLASVTAAREEFTPAVEFLGAAAHLRARAETPPHPRERIALDAVILSSRAALGDHEFQIAFERGHSAPPPDTLRAAANLTASSTVGSPQALVPPVQPEIQALGLGQSLVIRQIQVLAPSDWTYTKSKELFFYLLARRSATKEQIGLDLWADASPAQLRRIFHRVLRSLRQALGHNEWITYQDDVYALNPALPYSYDVATFDARLADAAALLRHGKAARVQAIAPLQQAVGVYQGDFLADVEGGDWILFRREELRQEYLQALLTLGQLHAEQNDYASAVAVYQRALAQDNYLEVAHRELMRAWARQGDTAQALRHYQTLIELLRTEFGAPPARETIALYERLRRGESV